jgi:AcrR family transcriptional regulator
MTVSDLTRKDERRTALLNAATELLARNPAASLAEIADYAGIGKATLHRYFAGREELMLALAERALYAVTDAIAHSEPEHGTAIEALTRIIEALVPLGDKLYLLLNDSALANHPDVAAAEMTSRAPMLALIQRGQASGELRTDLAAEWLLHQMDYALFATWQAVQDGWVARKEAARLLTKTLLGGMQAR